MSEQTKSVDRITEATKRFALGIAQTPEYEEYEAAANAYSEDQEARELLQRFQSAQQRAQMFGAWGGASGGNEEDLEALQAEVMANPTLARYFASQEALVKVLQETNSYMADKLGFDFAELTKPAGGCC